MVEPMWLSCGETAKPAHRGARLAPMIEPGKTFEVRMKPPRFEYS